MFGQEVLGSSPANALIRKKNISYLSLHKHVYTSLWSIYI
jgi:hypothetical protein